MFCYMRIKVEGYLFACDKLDCKTVSFFLSFFCCSVLEISMGDAAGAPNKKEYEKGLECSFLLYHIVLWPFEGLFVRVNII